MSARTRPAGAAAAPLLYWLLVVAGLAGVTLLRFDRPEELVPLWAGTLAGVGLGQLVALLRVRVWVLGALAAVGFWLVGPTLLLALDGMFGAAAETCLLALLPASLCGYLSLSERGALVAFWFPAVLWMLVILDGPASEAFDARGALPFVVGLGALFVAFLHARETRRVAIWRTHGSVRLAAPLPRTVLRASPVRAASQIVWTGLVGVAALVLTAWIAPHLWKKEQAIHARATLAGPGAETAAPPCCAGSPRGTKRERAREYLPLRHGRDTTDARAAVIATCVTCGDDFAGASASRRGSGERHRGRYGSGWTYAGSGGVAAGGDDPVLPATTTTPELVGAEADPFPEPPAQEPATAAPRAVAAPPPPTPPSDAARMGAGATAAAGAAPRSVALTTSDTAAPLDVDAPWRTVLALSAIVLALHALIRAVRRKITLRHLARPFWSETLDQRISNLWQRMLIGLADAGIHPARDEQPQAFARRVGIEGMQTCATILERVRHGVRVDAGDLEAMASATSAVYSAARAKAGVSGRATAWLRWPLA